MRPLQWEKLGLIFNPGDYNLNWIQTHAQAPASLVLGDRLRMYFSGRPAPDSLGQYVSLTGYVDLDLADLTRVVDVSAQPVMPLGGKGCFDEHGVYPFSAIQVGDELYGYHGGWSRCESVPFDVAIGLSKSNNGGRTFSRSFSGPVLGKSLEEPFVISGPKIRKFGDIFVLFYIAGTDWVSIGGKAEPVYRIRKATSTNGLDWVKGNKDLIPATLGTLEAQASPDVIESGGTYHMFFCYRGSVDFRGGPSSYRLGYASSQDMEIWERNDDRVGISSNFGDWDFEMRSYPHVFTVDDQIYMAYLGNDFGRYGFGLARLKGEL